MALVSASAVVLVLVLGGCSSPSSRTGGKVVSGEAEISTVQSIEFVGNYSFDDKTLRKQLDFDVGDYLDPILAETGRRMVAEYYRKKGFAYVRVMLNTAKLNEGKVIYIIDQGPRIQIKSIRFKGNRLIATSDLKKVIKTETRSWLFWPVFYTKEKIEEDVERLRRVYYERGFLDHHIEALGESHITFLIEEGPQYHIHQIQVEGNSYFDRQTLLEGLELEEGGVYYQRKAEAHADRIRKKYRQNGFIDAEVEHRVDFVEGPVPNLVNVVFEVEEGRQFRIGRVEITGNQNTQDRVIRRILDEYGFTPGQLYDADLAPKQGGGKLEKYVQRMTLAEQVIIRPSEPADGAADRTDLNVDVQEGLTGMWNPGVGFGSDSGFIGRLIYQQRNFDITDWPESFEEFITMRSFRGAGQTLRVALEPGTEVSEYSVTFHEPYFRDRPTSLDVVGSSYERFRESFDEGRLRSYVGFEQRREENWRRSLHFRLENVDVDSVDLDAPQEIYDVKGGNTLFGVKVGFGRNMTDDRFNPTSGYVFNTSYEQVTGEHNFGLLNGVYVRYRTLYEDLVGRRTVLATKIRAGTTVGDAPPFEKYYAGGTGTYGIRGFEYRGVSTRGLQTNVANPRRKDPIGSDWIFLAGAEVTVPLVGENFSALFFVDSGTIDTGGYRASLGTGVQILIPQWFGPVPMRFEVAVPFMKDDDDDTQVFSFSVGGLF